MDEHNLSIGDSFLVVDCGGGTVDLTVHKILGDKTIGEITERSGALCGSTYVDRNFITFLEKKVGKNAIEILKEKYHEYQYLIHKFFGPHVKFGFNGEPSEFRRVTLDFSRFCPTLKKYVGSNRIWISFEDIIAMFDPVVETITDLIRKQLSSTTQNCSAMFLVGGFSESPYLTRRIKDTFKTTVPYISISQHPITSVLRGAVIYGLNKGAIKNRILTMYYGVEIHPKWETTDPIGRKTREGRIAKFNFLANRGQTIELDEKCSGTYVPIYPDQKEICFRVFATPRYNAKYCDELGMKEIGELYVDLPDIHLGLDRPVEFSLMFGELVITATAMNTKNGKVYRTTFDYAKSDFVFNML
ncbi:10775_t:CDS:2 [Acaulospora colombiana]|uniref:10775_t:CDS:1 n=1 Tax=Acaulospora colombiana TaxID=27376 RepID=A0ACA9LGX2_9GLOM|nr:10775_t:CDS:2 [Acaulospora colombiana]